MFVRRGVRKIDNHHVQKPTRFGVSTIRYPVCSPIATGALWFRPPIQRSKPPQIEIWNTINYWNFCQNWMSSPPCTNVKPPHTNVKPPNWRHSCDGSAFMTKQRSQFGYGYLYMADVAGSLIINSNHTKTSFAA